MHPANSTCMDDKPSGHSQQRLLPHLNIEPKSYIQEFQINPKLTSDDKFSGPYKDYDPPGHRIPAVGERIWGDHPYLPSYLDPLDPPKAQPSGHSDNLYCRGPFYRGVTETHTEFVNRGVLSPRKYNEYVRHYQEPGMRDEKSVPQTDFTPPLPMLPSDKAPCLKQEPSKSWYKAEPKQPKNPHAKEHELRSQQPEVVFVDDAYKREFSTEHNDNFVCYHEKETRTKIKDPCPEKEEIFLKNIRSRHMNCKHLPFQDNVCDSSCKNRVDCPSPTPQRTTWLLHPKNYTFQNGIMLIPCKCRLSEMQGTYKVVE